MTAARCRRGLCQERWPPPWPTGREWTGRVMLALALVVGRIAVWTSRRWEKDDG